MGGYLSESAAALAAFEKMWSFNFFIVMLASVFVGSLYYAAIEVASYGLCDLLNTIAQAIPENSTFFMSYLLTETLLIGPLLDFLQIWSLLLAVPELICQAIPFLKGAASTLKTKQLPRAMQKLLFQNKYARASMVINVGMLFAIIAPLTLLPLLLWFFLVAPMWCHNFNMVLRPPQGDRFDSGGIFWPTVIKYQIFALAVSQLVLAAILVIMKVYLGTVLVVILVIWTLVRGNTLD